MRKVLLCLLLAMSAAPTHAEPVGSVPSRFVFEETATLGPGESIGSSPLGARFRIPITGGRFEGPGMSGKILPGGDDWQLKRADGSLVIDANYMIQTDDGVSIRVHNVGVIHQKPGDGEAYMWCAPTFEAPMGKYGWMNDAIFVSQLHVGTDPKNPTVRVTIYEIGIPPPPAGS